MKKSSETSPQIPTILENCQRKLLNIYDSYLFCKDRQFSSKRKDGFASFALATNLLVADHVRKYFPSFIQVEDCCYGDSKGSLFLRQLFTKNTSYNADQCLVINSIEGFIDALAAHKKIAYKGKRFKIEDIADHAEATLTSVDQCEVQFIEVDKKQQVSCLLQTQKERTKVLIVPEVNWVQYCQSQNIFYILEHTFRQGFKCGVCFHSSTDRLNDVNWLTIFQMASTLISTTVKATLQDEKNHQIEIQSMGKYRQKEPSKQAYLKMVQLDTGYRPKADNFFWTCGVTGCLHNTAFSVFSKGDVVGIDSPYYFFLSSDFKKSGTVFNFRPISKGTLFERIQTSYKAGEKGYMVVSPHNPTGIIFSPQQIRQICEWGVKHPDYSLIFDQIYLHSIHSKAEKTMSIVQYADKYNNFYMVRGFAKDYGICGFKVGYLITSNKKVQADFNRWQKLIRPQSYVLNAVERMLQKSQYGQKVYDYNHICLGEASTLIMNLLQEEGIEFIRPKSGIFIIIDLSKFMEENSQTEESVWTKLFYDYRTNIASGHNFKADKVGQFRLCYLIKRDLIVEGIRRIGKFIRKEKPIFD